jgi:hypothetical protein
MNHNIKVTARRISTASSLHLKAARWLVLAVSVAGMLAATATLVLIWDSTAATPLPQRINETTAMGSAILLLAVAFLVAWRAGDHPPNVAMALALVFTFSNIAFVTLLDEMPGTVRVRTAVATLTFILGGGFYIRAAQLFPRKLTPLDITSSPTIWGKVRPLRALLIFFLRAPAVWAFLTAATLLFQVAAGLDFAEAVRLLIVLMGVVYFYVMYRSADAEARSKVLWFFEAALATLVISLIAEGVRAVLHGSGSPTLRVVLSVVIYSLNCLALVVCIFAAVFYAGAISPALVIRKTFIYGATAALLLFGYAIVESYVVNRVVEVAGISDRFASALLGTLFGLAFHPIKNRMDHLLRPAEHLAAPGVIAD